VDKELLDFMEEMKQKLDTIDRRLVTILAVNTLFVAFYLMQLFKIIQV
jgi:hypothetical protein